MSQSGQEGVQVACGPATPICATILLDALAKATAFTGGALISLWAIDEGSQLLAEKLEEGGDPETIVVNPDGVAVPVGPGESATSSPDGKWIQVRDKAGRPTGVRLDDGHPSHKDPRARTPHAHLPERTNPDGTPWLPPRGGAP